MKLTKATSPHIRSEVKTGHLMFDVIGALVLALGVGVFRLGLRALYVVLLSMISALVFEALCCLITRRPLTLKDGSALVTGLLFAMTLPASVPFWQVILGDFFAIVVVKALFGGLGQNLFNPALAARAFLMLVFPADMTRYSTVDGVSSATPLHHMVMPALPEESLLEMFFGDCPGSIGELSSFALLLGGIYLVARRVISPRIPLAYLGTVAVLSFVFFKTDDPILWTAYTLFSGGLMLGAIFMATDYVTSPVTPRGQIVYGIGCGALTLFFRYNGLFPEGVTYAILCMNLCVYLIERYTAPPRFGARSVKGGNKQ